LKATPGDLLTVQTQGYFVLKRLIAAPHCIAMHCTAVYFLVGRKIEENILGFDRVARQNYLKDFFKTLLHILENESEWAPIT
jgi:hypothetical protein